MCRYGRRLEATTQRLRLCGRRGCGFSFGFEVPGGECAFAFDVDGPAQGGVEVVLDELVGAFGDLDPVGSPWDSIRLAMLTVSPHMSYWNLLVPTTPATAGPELIPMRKLSGPVLAYSSISNAIAAMASAWSSRGVGTPAATM